MCALAMTWFAHVFAIDDINIYWAQYTNVTVEEGRHSEHDGGGRLCGWKFLQVRSKDCFALAAITCLNMDHWDRK